MLQNMDQRLPNIFPAIAQMKGKVYATKIYHHLLMRGLHATNYGRIFCCSYVPVFNPKSRWYSLQIQHLSKSGSWLTRLRKRKLTRDTTEVAW